jgi:hypothetical protein
MRITKRQIKEKTAELINVHTTANREKYEFDTKVGLYTRIHAALGECIAMVEELVEGSGSFVQIAKKANMIVINSV